MTPWMWILQSESHPIKHHKEEQAGKLDHIKTSTQARLEIPLIKTIPRRFDTDSKS